ncbi:wall-associated receptor kinase 5-like [Nymphaea colorata]|uniref:wall-associated receptor kinase 5-like n=1 Tax=Nymphaea colorata TaxID=210225 RepID=UPI00129E9EEE|nr:wall-associated receptor kinase 5-like [Nymphaea colorata]
MTFLSSSVFNLTLFFFSFFIAGPLPVLSQACKSSCGDLPIRYPFGTGPGCGDPRFQNFVTCKCDSPQGRERLVLTAASGSYTIQWIDYGNHIIYIQDPTISTCSCMQPSRGFALDWSAPFSFPENTVFALLGCSVTASPVFNNSFNNNFKKNNAPLCDVSGGPICSQIYACPAVVGLNLPLYSPASSCCVYSPVDLGPSFDMDLKKLQCESYTAVIDFDYRQLDAAKWKYGIALKYRFSVNNVYPLSCLQCENSNGVCGYVGSYNSFACNCPFGVTTSTDCSFQESFWSHGVKSNNIPRVFTGFIMYLVLELVILLN